MRLKGWLWPMTCSSVVVGIIVFSAGMGGSSPVAAPVSPQDTVEALAVEALRIDQSSFVPASLSSAAPASTSFQVAGPRDLVKVPPEIASGASAAEISDTDIKGRAKIDSVFSGAPRAKILEEHARVIAGLKGDPTFRPLGGGVDSAVWDSVVVNGDTATVHGNAVLWSEMAQLNPVTGIWSVARPSASVIVSMTMRRDASGKWIVETYDWDFPPGYSP
jgi:hypothetical protein